MGMLQDLRPQSRGKVLDLLGSHWREENQSWRHCIGTWTKLLSWATIEEVSFQLKRPKKMVALQRYGCKSLSWRA